MVVFARQISLLQGTHAAGPAPNPFDVRFLLDEAFSYDPSQGDLLMDVRVFDAIQIQPPLENPLLDYTSNDSNLHRIFSHPDNDVNSTFGQSQDNTGLDAVHVRSRTRERGAAAVGACGSRGRFSCRRSSA